MNTTTASSYSSNKIHPLKLTLWVGIGSIIMMFASLTSAFVVRRAAGNWYEFKLPDLFFINTLVLVLSSITLQMSYQSFKRSAAVPYRRWMVATFILGWLFVILQYQGWMLMTAAGATFTINPSSSFIYLISGVHAAHVLGGIVALVVAMVFAFRLPVKPTPRRLMRFELVLQYWHFVDILWIYLIIFFALYL